MLLYEGPTVNFVFVYDAERLRSSQAPVDAGSIIKGTGFLPQPSGAVLKRLYECRWSLDNRPGRVELKPASECSFRIPHFAASLQAVSASPSVFAADRFRRR